MLSDDDDDDGNDDDDGDDDDDDDEGGGDGNLVMATQPRVPSAPGQLLSAYTVTHSPTTFSCLLFFYL